MSGVGAIQSLVTKRDEPDRIFASLPKDKVTALNAAQSVTSALFARATGRGGQHIEVSMMEARMAGTARELRPPFQCAST